MIAYDYMAEAWTDDEDFKVSMTPEGDRAELQQKFATKEEFWVYYYNGQDNEGRFQAPSAKSAA